MHTVFQKCLSLLLLLAFARGILLPEFGMHAGILPLDQECKASIEFSDSKADKKQGFDFLAEEKKENKENEGSEESEDEKEKEKERTERLKEKENRRRGEGAFALQLLLQAHLGDFLVSKAQHDVDVIYHAALNRYISYHAALNQQIYLITHNFKVFHV